MAVLVPTIRLQRGFDNRQDGRSPVARKAVSIVVSDGVNTITSSAIELNGLWPMFLIASPAIPTDATFDISIKDEDGVVIYSDTGLADTSIVYVDVPSTNAVTPIAAKNIYLAGKHTITITFTTVLSGNTATFDIVFVLVNP